MNTLRTLLALSLVLVCSSAFAAEKPNIVVLLCDDLGYGDLACFAHPTILTPNLDKLAKQGAKLTHCYAAAPVCSPSRAGLMTGRVPNRLGIRDWIPAASGIFLRPGETTVAQVLKQAGYKTCHAGKWHLNSKVNGTEPTPGDAGFDHWMYTQNNAAPNHLDVTNFIRNGKRVGKIEGPSSHAVVAEGIQFLEANKGQPFFLNLWFHETHEIVAAADEFLKLYPKETDLDKRHYYGDVSQMDAAVGKLLTYLDEKKLADNTLVFFTSDNGPETLHRYPNAKRSHGSPGPLRGMKLHVTEGGYRVPGIVRWPGHVKPDTVIAEPVCNVDLLPTFAAAGGATLPTGKTLDGVDIAPLFVGKPVKRPHPLYWQYDAAISTPWTVALREGGWKLVANAGLDRFELYDLSNDVAEAKNAAGANPDRVKQMAAEMKRLHAEINAEGARSGNPTTSAAEK